MHCLTVTVCSQVAVAETAGDLVWYKTADRHTAGAVVEHWQSG